MWVVQPFTSGAVIGEALSSTSDPFRSVVSAAAWLLWLVILLALALPQPISLTVARVGAVGGVMATAWAALEVPSSTSGGLIGIGVLAAAAAFATINMPGVGDRFVDGVSYGDEQRFLLRAPGPALFTLIGPAAVIVVLGASVGPLLLADEQWIAGAIATVVGFAIAAVPLMALHRLTSRFLVFVPNGLVVHDRSQLREPVLFVTREIALGPAPADTTARDITAGALGLALELRFSHMTELPFVTGRTTTETKAAKALLISPTRTGAVLQTAVERKIAVN